MRADADSALHRDYVRSLIGDRCDREPAGQASTSSPSTTASRASGASCARGASTSCRSCGTSCAARCALVGPRPVIEYEVEQYPDWYLRRFAVKPGLTGLWQVSGRNERTYEEMVRLDVEYAERHSLRLDLRILARTAWVVLARQGVA